jgi:hypothetical protein
VDTMAKIDLELKRQALKNALTRLGFKPDNYGHMQKDSKVTSKDEEGAIPVKLRIKFGINSIRYEIKRIGHNNWFKKDGEFYKDIVIDNEGVKLTKYKLRFLDL